MKKLFAFLVGIIIIAIILFMLFGGFGFGTGSGSGAGERGASSSQTVDEVDDSTKNSAENDQPDEKGADSNKDTIIEVAVVKSEYFYENRSINLDNLIKIIDAMEGKIVVEVTDDNAALRPYNKLLDKLGELEIPYIERVAN